MFGMVPGISTMLGTRSDCPACGDASSYLLATRDLLQCRACRRQTSVMAGTALDRTRRHYGH